MGAGGVRKNTRYGNTTQPYNVGFLNHKEEVKDYNVAVYDELQKVQVSSTHMFQGLDDVKNEIENRTKALQALHLTVNEEFNRVDETIAGLTVSLGQIKVETITDKDGNPLTGILDGIKESVHDGEVETSRINGVLITQDGRIGVVESNIKAANNSITETQRLIQGVDGKYEAQWGVTTSVAGHTGGVAFVNAGGKTSFTVTADQFKIAGASGSSATPFQVIGGVTYIDSASIRDGSITNAKIGGTLQSDNWNSSGGSAGWAITKDGRAYFRNAEVTGTINANAGVFNNVTVNGNIQANGNSVFRGRLDGVSGTFTGSINATQINGDVAVAHYLDAWQGNTAQNAWQTVVSRGFHSQGMFGRSVVITVPTVHCHVVDTGSGSHSASGSYQVRILINGTPYGTSSASYYHSPGASLGHGDRIDAVTEAEPVTISGTHIMGSGGDIRIEVQVYRGYTNNTQLRVEQSPIICCAIYNNRFF